jgi:hypothetical protein
MAAAQTELTAAQNVGGTVKEDSLPLVLGVMGMVFGLMVIVLVFVRTRKPSA